VGSYPSSYRQNSVALMASLGRLRREERSGDGVTDLTNRHRPTTPLVLGLLREAAEGDHEQEHGHHRHHSEHEHFQEDH
jgi:hypothetical protein